MDFITGLPKLEGKNDIMVIVDQFMKCTLFSSFSHPLKESIVTTIFMEIVQKLLGIFKIIVSNRNPIFIGIFWTKSFSCLGTQLGISPLTILNRMRKLRL